VKQSKELSQSDGFARRQTDRQTDRQRERREEEALITETEGVRKRCSPAGWILRAVRKITNCIFFCWKNKYPLLVVCSTERNPTYVRAVLISQRETEGEMGMEECSTGGGKKGRKVDRGH